MYTIMAGSFSSTNSRLAFAAVAGAWLILVLLVHISAVVVPSEASILSEKNHVRPYYPMKGAQNGGGGSKQLAVTTSSSSSPSAPLEAGVSYRPPIINMKYFGGPVMWKPIHLNFIWYGTWTTPEKNLIRTVSNSLTPNHPIRQYPNLSNLWSIITTYYQELQHHGDRRKHATNSVTIATEIDDHYSHGHTINTDTDPLNIIHSHLSRHRQLPTDLEQSIYFVFTSADVVFLENPSYCGYHDNQCVDPARAGTPFCDELLNNIIYSFVPIPSVDNGLLSVCNVFETTSTPGSGLRGLPPNYMISPTGALDSIITVFLHELLETAVDPVFYVKPAWIYNETENSETSDLCSYTFVAGDWFYCDLPSVYPDFDGECDSLGDHHSALTDPEDGTTFNLYGIDGVKVVAQQIWSLGNKGCVLQPEESCPRKTAVLHKAKGTIQRGLFFEGVGLQRYAPGQNCSWKILVCGAKFIRLHFEEVALGYDDKDYVTVANNKAMIKKKLTGFGKKIQVKIAGSEATIRFVSYGGRSPYPSSAGFIMHYEADF